MDSISAVDIESGRIARKDKDGNIVGYTYYGPSLVQKATGVGILVDKSRVLQDYEKALQIDTASGQLMMPGDFASLRNSIDGKIKELNLINIQFATDNPSLVRETQELVAEIDAMEATEAAKPDVIGFDDFES